MGEREQRQAADLVKQRYPTADPGFRQVMGALLVQRGWRLLACSDPARPGVHACLIGRGGVLAVVIGDHLPDHDAARALLAEAEHGFASVRVGGRVLASPGLVAVRPGAGEARSRADGLYQAVRAADLAAYLGKVTTHLTNRQVDALVERARLPGFAELMLAARTRPAEAPGLLDPDDLRDEQVVAAKERSFASWLTFLHPAQRGIVTRRFSGPARISGPAGTGKTVVALHRLRHLARRTTGPLLFTTFVRTLPAVHRESFLRLASELDDRVEFIGLHAWAGRLLAERGIPADLNRERIGTAMAFAWKGHRDALEQIAPFSYWKTEVDTVIKGRGIRSLAEYEAVERRGRIRNLGVHQRARVWAFYEAYQMNLAAKGLVDYNDLIEIAWREIDEPPYAAVVADEVQDISLMGLRLLHKLAGSGPDGLLLVGDGQQQVYPGGWRLSEADITVRGRGAVLKVNYRNGSEILDFAKGLGATNEVDDLDGAAGVSLQDAEAVHAGGRVRRWRGPLAELPLALAEAVRGLESPRGRSAVIVLDGVDRAVKMLRKAGIETALLEHYVGQEDDVLKVGTVHRAKGLDFQAVIAVHTPSDDHDDDARELRARQLLVAATRARDELWWIEVAPVTQGSPGASAVTQR